MTVTDAMRLVVTRWVGSGAPHLDLRVTSRRWWTRSPLTAAVLIAATTMFAAAQVAGPPRQLVDALALYRGEALFRGDVWQLPLSALLSQSWLQWAWTLLIGLTLLAEVEARLGSWRMLLVLVLSHVAPTVAMAMWARTAGAHTMLTVPDFGTSCLLMGGAGAALWLWRSKLFAAVLAITLLGDLFLNSTMTIAEHLLAVLIGATVAAALGLPSRQTRIPADHAAAHATVRKTTTGEPGKACSA